MSISSNPIEITAASEAVPKPLLPSPALSNFSGHHYAQSPSGVDSNLLILLHGLGDSDAGFFNLGKNLQNTLPQTAVLAIQAPHAVPFLDGGKHWMWYPSFDQFGELLTQPNPSTTLQNMVSVLEHLTEKCGWSPSSIHIFGFGQGATIALETLVSWSKTHPNPTERLGSIVSISGEILSHPATTITTATPVLQIYRSRTGIARETATKWASFRKAFGSAFSLQRLNVTEQGSDEAMLRGGWGEWDGVIQFWSKFLRNRSAWEREGKVVPLS
ncbi:uncharacterized protein UDID_08185 [Ustilago sp. UG-2017a]|nr:uncharacterized protein UDID_08185 [Ustilago sp. UG-2017a]